MNVCGIIGIASGSNVSRQLLECIKKLEYRGYDSVGMACVKGQAIDIRKDAGKIEHVDSKVSFCKMEGSTGIAHSRWSTHGKTTKENAHPHTDCSGKIAIVHNGIIENYQELKKKLTERGHKFKSETDTEVIAHLIEENNRGNLREAVAKAVSHLEGSYALAVVTAGEDRLIAVRNESPLVVGVGRGINAVASDVPAIISLTRDIIFIGNNEIAELTKDRAEVFDLKGRQLDRKPQRIEWDAEMAEKQGFEHFMLKEIFEQPRVIEELAGSSISDGKVVVENEIGLSREEIKKVGRIVIVACGTSWHAGLVGEFMIEELARIPAEVEYASEFRYRNPLISSNDLVIAISQSGETADTLAALREARKKGAKIISVCNVRGSSIARESDMVFYTKAGPEIGVASTKAFTSQLVALYLMTVHMASVRGAMPPEQVSNRVRDLRKLPLQMQSILEDKSRIMQVAEDYRDKTNALYLGRGINYPIALEGALKLKEISYIHAEGYPAAEMKHGPIALIDREMPVVFIATKDNRTYTKVLSNIEEVKARGGIIIAIATKGDEQASKLADDIIYIPETSYILTPVLAAIPLQMIAYYIAKKKGYDVDKPRNLAKSVTVE